MSEISTASASIIVPGAEIETGAASRRRAWLTALLVVVGVMVLTQRDERSIIGGLLPPDGIEYATAAQRLATLGTYSIVAAGKIYPPRYPPGFSLLLTPAYWLRPNDLAAGVWVVRGLWAAACGVLAFALARRFGTAATLLLCALLVVHPTLAVAAASILSDVPSVAALVAVLGIRLFRPNASLPLALLQGVILAIAVACRPQAITFALMLLPDLWTLQHRVTRALLLFGPSISVIAATKIYDRITFGSFVMNGYAYWCPLPYDRLDYVFHPSYLRPQLNALFFDPWASITIAVGLASALFLRQRAREVWRSAARPLLLAVTPLTIIHFLYFFAQSRLFIPLLTACLICTGLAAAVTLGVSRAGRTALISMAIAIIAFGFIRPPNPPTWDGVLRGEIVAEMRLLPERCRIITIIEPTLVDAIATHGTDREWIAATRTQEYANKVIATHPMSLDGISRPPPVDHLQPALIAQGATFSVTVTADDDLLLERFASEDVPLFVDKLTIARLPGLTSRLDKFFVPRVLAEAPNLLRCVPRRVTATPSTQSGRAAAVGW